MRKHNVLLRMVGLLEGAHMEFEVPLAKRRKRRVVLDSRVERGFNIPREAEDASGELGVVRYFGRTLSGQKKCPMGFLIISPHWMDISS